MGGGGGGRGGELPLQKIFRKKIFFLKYWAENLKFAKIALLVWNFSQPIAFLYETEEKGAAIFEYNTSFPLPTSWNE